MSGLEMAVEVSDHSIKCSMEKPDESQRAWDPDMFKSGNLFVSGYANPIKPDVESNPELKQKNTVDVREGGPDVTAPDGGTVDSQAADVPDEIEADAEPDSDGPHVQLISSGRYQKYMQQNLIEQLLTPESRWNTLVYAILGVAALGFVQIIVTLYATGSF